MPSHKHCGKNIKKIERISGKLISDLALEATAFSSLHEYAVEFCRHYRCPGKMIRGVQEAILQYAVEEKGREWCEKYYKRGGKYLRVAGESLGVAPEEVIQHLATHDIDLARFVNLTFKKNKEKAYSFFFTRISRSNYAHI